MTIFGNLITGEIIENDVRNHLQKWLPTYLRQLATDRGLPRTALPLPKLWMNTTEFDTDFSADNTPAILIICTGISGTPVREGDGTYRAAWTVGVGVLASAGGNDSRRNSSALAKRYAGAIKWAMLQYSSLGSPYVEGVDWEDEGYDDVPSDQQSALASARLVFSVEYRDVIETNAGPGAPDPLPDPDINTYPEWGTVQDSDHVHIDVRRTK